MTQFMQAGKIYYMRPVGHQTFTDGYFQDNRFFKGGPFHVSDVAANGAFIYQIKLPDGSPRFPKNVAGSFRRLSRYPATISAESTASEYLPRCLISFLAFEASPR